MKSVSLKYEGIIFLTILTICLVCSFAPKASAFDPFEVRTWKRLVSGAQTAPDGLFVKRKHQEFTSYASNWDIQGEFPEAWENEEWDTSKWPDDWRENMTMVRLFRGQIFKQHYLKDGKMPVLVLGPVFYKLSDLDRNRVLKFFANESGILKKGADIIELVDWGTHKIVGAYTEKGMFLY